MKTLVVTLILSCCLMVSAAAAQDCYDEVSQLRREVEVLRRQNAQLNQARRAAPLYSRNRSYRYGHTPLSGATRSMREAEQFKRSWERLID